MSPTNRTALTLTLETPSFSHISENFTQIFVTFTLTDRRKNPCERAVAIEMITHYKARVNTNL